MRLNNINITTECFEEVCCVNGNIVSVAKPFDKLSLETRNGHYIVDTFALITNVSVLGDKNDVLDNVLERKGKLDILLRLSTYNANTDNYLGVDLCAFSIDFLRENLPIVRDGETSYYNMKQVSYINNLEFINGCGEYILKVLVKDERMSEWQLQAKISLKIVEKLANSK